MKSDWQQATISDVCLVVTDGSHNSPPSVEHGEYMVSVKDFTPYGFDFSSCRQISSEDYITLKKAGCVPMIDDILIGKDGARFFEDIILYRQPEQPALLSSIAILRVNKNIILPEFLYYILKTPSFKKDVRDNYGSGSAIPRIVLKDFKRMPISYPDITTQRKIINILIALDNRIQTNLNINNALFQMTSALYTSMFSNTFQQAATIGQYSEQIYSGGTPSTSMPEYWNGPLHWFSSGETRNRFVINTEKTITQEGVDNSSTRLAQKYDIVMASAGQGLTRGQTTMLLLDTYVNQSVIVIHSDRLHLPYLFWNLASRYDELRAISDSSSIRGSITTKMIAGFEIPEVNSQSLKKFADFAWSIIPEIERNLLENERLTALRDALLPRFMYDMIDVSNIAI